jgi:hypothetical protein
MKLKIKTRYRIGSDTYVHKLGSRVSIGLKGNPALPNPKPSQPELEKACQDFNVSISLAGRNDMTLASAKNDKKAELIRMLDEIAEYVTTTSNGDRTILLSSGFDITGLKGSSKELAPIEKLIVEIGVPGQATTRVKMVSGAKAYVHQYTPDPMTPDSVWVSETSTDREHTFTNLKSVAKYWLRVIAVGKGKQMVYSPPVAMVIQ